MDQAGSSLSGEQLRLKFIQSKRGKPVLLLDGFRYNYVVKNKSGTSNWRCFNKNECNTSITLDSNNQIVKKAKHSCVPNQLKNSIDEIMDECKKQVCINLEPIPKVFEDFINNIKHNLQEEDLPNYESVKDMLRKARLDYLHCKKLTCNNLKDLMLPEELVKNFFLYDCGIEGKILIFGTPLAKKYLKKFKKFYGDGTFRVVPSVFYQLYTLHVDLSEEDDEMVNFVPLLYILLSAKDQQTYVRLFTILKNQFSVNIEHYKCDYEIATINGLRSVFPEVIISGCYYHFAHAVWKMSKKLKFDKVTAQIDGNELNMTTLYIRLALLPPDIIPEGYFELFYIGIESEEFTKFNDYFRRQWMEVITSETFSCYNEKFRTTNAVEGWHRRINARIIARPSIFLFIQLIKKEATYQDRKIKKKERFQKEKRRRVSVLQKNCSINKIISGILKQNKDYSIVECLRRLSSVK